MTGFHPLQFIINIKIICIIRITCLGSPLNTSVTPLATNNINAEITTTYHVPIDKIEDIGIGYYVQALCEIR